MSNSFGNRRVDTFSSEFIFLKTDTELVEYLYYKLRMFGISIEGQNSIFYDNEYVYKNMSTPESTLKNKNISIFYHNYREAVAAGAAWIAKEGAFNNMADMFTKMLIHIRRETLLDNFTY